MGEVSCYSMDLYCDGPDHRDKHGFRSRVPDVFTGHTFAECIRAARKDGWSWNPKGKGEQGSGRAVCPKCREQAAQCEGANV